MKETIPDILAAINHEQHRQDEGLELIASENFVSLVEALLVLRGILGLRLRALVRVTFPCQRLVRGHNF